MANTTITARLGIALVIATAAVALPNCTSDPAHSQAAGGNASGDAGTRNATSAAATSNGGAGVATGSQASNGGFVANAGGSLANAGGSLAKTGGNGSKGGAASVGGSSSSSNGSRGGAASVGGSSSSSNGSRGGASTVTGGTTAIGGASAGTTETSVCSASNLVWKTANKTNYTSYPDPGSEECIKYNGCTWAGQFAACDATQTEAWVAAHNIVAAFPNFQALKLHDLCLRKGSKTIVVTVLDTCGDSDCDGCCTQNKGNADALIDIESYTNARWGVPDGSIEWADLGLTKGSGCN